MENNFLVLKEIGKVYLKSQVKNVVSFLTLTRGFELTSQPIDINQPISAIPAVTAKLEIYMDILGSEEESVLILKKEFYSEMPAIPATDLPYFSSSMEKRNKHGVATLERAIKIFYEKLRLMLMPPPEEPANPMEVRNPLPPFPEEDRVRMDKAFEVIKTELSKKVTLQEETDMEYFDGMKLLAKEFPSLAAGVKSEMNEFLFGLFGD